jgi:hypothetical protein
MRRILFTSLLCALLAIPAFARVKPLKLGEKPHTFWRHDIHPVWNGRSLDEFDNSRLNSDNSGQIQNEQQVCINPTNPENRVAVWRDFRLGYRRVGFGYTFDGGNTWTDALFPQMYYEWASDPILVVDEEGVFTAMVISLQSAAIPENGLLQISSYDGGVTWRDSVWAALSTDGRSFEDKEMLAVDTSALSAYRGNFYCTWAHFYVGEFGQYDSTKIFCTVKQPGEPYSEPVIISPDQTSVQWPNVAIGIFGEIYISWVGWVWDEETEWAPCISFAKSFDGGQTFSQPVVFRQNEFIYAEINPSLVTYAFAPMAVDHSEGPHRGRLYMLFTSSENFEDTDVFLVYSDDHGETWSTPVMMNDDNSPFPADQFHPWLSVDEAGRIWVVFYDRRNDPNNLLMDVYFTVSDDGGETWRPNERITDESCNPGAGSLDAGLIGEYIGWCAQGGEAVAVWTDTRMGNQDCFTTVIDSIFIDTTHAVPGDDFVYQPASISLFGYPNPTNSEVSLRYSISTLADVKLELFNTLGQSVRVTELGSRSPGDYTIHENLNDLATGLYLARLSAGPHSTMTKIMLLK